MFDLAKRLEKPVNIGSIVVFRMCFGVLMMIEVGRYLANGWVAKHFSGNNFHFTYPYFDWIEPLPWVGMIWFFFCLGILAIFIALGLFYRLAIALFTLGMTYVFLIDKANYLNHFYLIILISLLMCFIPANRAFAVDERRNPIISSETLPSWCLWVLRLQLGIVYFFSGVAKINSDWLGGEPFGRWLAKLNYLPVVGHLVTEPWFVAVFTYGGMFFDLLIFPLLLWRRTRYPAIALAIAFHLTNAVLFEIGVFPWFMIAATLLFLPPSWPHFSRRLWPEIEERKMAQRFNPPQPWRRKTLIVLGVVYLVLQIFLPLRHLLYPGDVNWTKEGSRFAWRMKLNRKHGRIAFYYLSDRSPVKRRKLSLERHLTKKQIEKLQIWPDMILDFSHYLRRTLEKDGHQGVKIFAVAIVSLNGREPQAIVAPDMNLAEFPRGRLGPEPWIVPLTF